MTTISVEEAQSRLSELIEHLKPGEEVLITRAELPVARLVGERPVRKPRQPGLCRGMLIIHTDDDDHLKDFGEYMP